MSTHVTDRVHLDYARQIREHALAYRRGLSTEDLDPANVRRILLILSASRGGSSLLYHLLGDSSDVLSLAGEHVPFYKLHGFDPRASPDRSDRVDRWDPVAAAELARTVLSEVRIGPYRDMSYGPELIGRMAFRLALQWPGLEVPWDVLVPLVGHACASGTSFASALRREMSHAGLTVDWSYYDLPGPREQRPTGPPDPRYCLEEPPFVLPAAARIPDEEDLATKPLILKAPLDAYRLPLVLSLFPHAEVRVVHMIRAPEPSVNGLYDGWHDRGFYSHNIEDFGHTLAIDGYTDGSPWSTRWWNFDLPPGWQDLAEAPLEDVCAFQWSSVHGHILRGLDRHPELPVLRVRFEDLTCCAQGRSATLTTIRAFAGVPRPDRQENIGPAPVVMASRPPDPMRWLARRDLISRAVHRPWVADIAAELGYPLVREPAWA
jgi:hypothetical protein